MSTVALKLGSLAIRTLSKPIANFIKRQSREHEGFRQTCIKFGQTLHRIDMRLRLGILRDTTAIEMQAAKEAAEAQAKRNQHSIPTVKTEAQTKLDDRAIAKAAKEAADAIKHAPKPRIRPVSEAKAVEFGANFISEAFLFGVAGGLIFFESWRSRRKETSRREDVADRLSDLEESEKAARRALVELEREVLRLRAKEARDTKSPQRRILPREVYEVEEAEEKAEEEVSRGWLNRIVSYVSSRSADEEAKAALATNAPGPAEKILVQADAALAEKHRQAELAAIEEAQKSATIPANSR